MYIVHSHSLSALSNMAEVTKRYAVVTGGNRGIGFGISKQLAASGMTVVLTARDEKKGLEAVDKIKDFGVSGKVLFHQLDVAEPASIDSLASFIKTQFGKLDILEFLEQVFQFKCFSLMEMDGDALVASLAAGVKINDMDSKVVSQSYESVEAGVRTNYYGSKRMCEGLVPLLELSDSPRIVNVSSLEGKLENIPSGWAKEVLSNTESLTELDEVISQFLKDFKEGSLETKGWPAAVSAYRVSKAALNAYTRILAKRYPSFCINAVCPGYVKSDFNFNTGIFTVDEGAERVVRLALLPNGGPSGLFFSKGQVTPF